MFGVDVDGAAGSRGYVAAANLATGDPVWEYQTDVDGAGHILNDGCGNVWSSGTVLPKLGLVVFGGADCHFSNPPPLNEAVFALHISDGHLAWVFRPDRSDNQCDLDFGATPNAGVGAGGATTFLGAGSKDGTYYSIDPATGRQRWATNVVFGGFTGGFMATSAYDGQRVYGATGQGDFGRFEHGNGVLCDPANPRDTAAQEPSMHAINGSSGAVAWQETASASFSPTTVAGGLTFNGPALLGPLLDIRLARTGALIDQVKLPQANWSGVATVGDALVLGVGSSYDPTDAGVLVLTPKGRTPVVPG